LSELPGSLAAAVAATSVTEWLAVSLALAYLGLAIRLIRWCWLCALLSAGLYAMLMFRAGLYMESALQIFYMALAVYGWRQWQAGARGRSARVVVTWPAALHGPGVILIVLLTLVSGAALSRVGTAAFPFLDSFTTWGAVVATWLTARKVLQSWHYWFVIDSVSIYLYVERELALTAALFIVYLVLIVAGYRTWRGRLPAAPAAL